MAEKLPGAGRVNERVFRWLRRNPAWASAGVDELGGGRSHRAWRLRTPTRSGVLKLDAEARDWPGNSRSAEALVQAKAAQAGLAAPVHWHSTEGILTGWIDGLVLGAAELRDERVLRDVGAALGRLHALPPVGRCFELREWSAHYRDVLMARGRFDTAAREACELLESVALPGPRVLAHNDLVPANIVTGDGIRFLDWEYAADNSWLFDLATLHVEAALDADATALLFESYSGSAAVPAAFGDAVAVYRELVRLWETSALPAVS